LNSILRNEKYIGTYVFGRQSRKLHNSHKDSDDIIRIPDGIPRIIDNDTWIVAQERVRSHRRNPAYTAKRTYILSGKLECSCGTIMTGAASVNEKGSYRYYRCRHCGKSVNADQVEREVLARISDRMHFTRADAVSIRRVLEREQTADVTLKTELRNVQKQISNILEAIQQGIFHPQLKSNLDALMEKEKEIQQQMSFSDVPSVESIMTFLESISDVSAYDVEKQADIVKRLIEKIKIVGTQFDIEFRLSLVAGDRTLSWYKYTVRL
jgi:site-specific DNA recombinase